MAHLNLPKDAARVTVEVVPEWDVLHPRLQIQEGFHMFEEPGLVPSTDNVELRLHDTKQQLSHSFIHSFK